MHVQRDWTLDSDSATKARFELFRLLRSALGIFPAVFQNATQKTDENSFRLFS